MTIENVSHKVRDSDSRIQKYKKTDMSKKTIRMLN